MACARALETLTQIGVNLGHTGVYADVQLGKQTLLAGEQEMKS